MISSLLYWLVQLVYVFGVSSACYLLLWLGSQIWKNHPVIMPTDSMNWSDSAKRRAADGIWPSLLQWTLRVSIVVTTFIVGYATRDLQSYRVTKPRYGDLIIEHRSASSFRMVAQSGMEFETDLCPGSVPNDLSVGNLINWSYEQRSDCKRLIYYVAATNPKTGQRIKFDVSSITLRKEVSEK